VSDARQEPSRRLVMQRVHNRMIEYWEFASSVEAQREFERTHPFAAAAWEVIEQWADWEWAHGDPLFREPAFTSDERGAVNEFHRVWAPIARTSRGIPDDLESAARTDEFARIREAAARSLEVFRVRGRLPEDEEIVGG
jgi:hypothetical protein